MWAKEQPLRPRVLCATKSSSSILGTTYVWSQIYTEAGTLKMSRFGQYSSYVYKNMVSKPAQVPWDSSQPQGPVANPVTANSRWLPRFVQATNY